MAVPVRVRAPVLALIVTLLAAVPRMIVPKSRSCVLFKVAAESIVTLLVPATGAAAAYVVANIAPSATSADTAQREEKAIFTTNALGVES